MFLEVYLRRMSLKCGGQCSSDFSDTAKRSEFPGQLGQAQFLHIAFRATSSTILLFRPDMALTPLIAGMAVAAAAMAGKYGIEAWQTFRTRPAVPRIRRFYEGGFQPMMTRREAALILGVRESAAQEKIKEAHRRVIAANHPDAGGSHYLASKINEAKDHLLGQKRGSGSAF